MANPNRQNRPDTARSEQGVLNTSFDEEFDVLAVETLVYNQSTGTLDRATGDLRGANTIKFASISASASGDNTVISLVSAKKIKVLSVILVASGTVSVKWRSNTTDISGAMPLVANSGFVLPASSPGQGHYFETAAGQALNINLSGAVAVNGHISYYEEA
jgi:hypothetical protein